MQRRIALRCEVGRVAGQDRRKLGFNPQRGIGTAIATPIRNELRWWQKGYHPLLSVVSGEGAEIAVKRGGAFPLPSIDDCGPRTHEVSSPHQRRAPGGNSLQPGRGLPPHPLRWGARCAAAAQLTPCVELHGHDGIAGDYTT